MTVLDTDRGAPGFDADGPDPGSDLAAAELTVAPDDVGFRVRLDNFEGPFDLLLTLIGKHRLDVTEVALHIVTDEFIVYTRELGDRADLDHTTEFLVVAATLLDLKAARLLPSGEVEDAEDLAMLEARDLLFARLLQYRAYKQAAEIFSALEGAALQRYPRAVSLEDRYVSLLPEVTLGVDPLRFAEIAAAAFRPKPIPAVGLGHLHVSPVSVPEQAIVILDRLRDGGVGTWMSFADLVADCTVPVMIVARFLALLELFREQVIAFEQPEPLGDLQVSWTGTEASATLARSDDYG